jgi:hypothetical protein
MRFFSVNDARSPMFRAGTDGSGRRSVCMVELSDRASRLADIPALVRPAMMIFVIFAVGRRFGERFSSHQLESSRFHIRDRFIPLKMLNTLCLR